MYFPQELKYTRSHEWVRFDGARATVGISDYAQFELGDVVVFESGIEVQKNCLTAKRTPGS